MKYPKRLINEIIRLVQKFPNDMEVGGKIRHLINKQIQRNFNDRD